MGGGGGEGDRVERGVGKWKCKGGREEEEEEGANISVEISQIQICYQEMRSHVCGGVFWDQKHLVVSKVLPKKVKINNIT